MIEEGYKNWEDLNFDERAEVLKAFQNTEDRNESDKDNPREEDVKDYYEDNAEKFNFVGFDRKKARYIPLNELFKIGDEVNRSGTCPNCGSKRIEEYCDGLPCCLDCEWCLGFDSNKGHFEYKQKQGKRDTGLRELARIEDKK